LNYCYYYKFYIKRLKVGKGVVVFVFVMWWLLSYWNTHVSYCYAAFYFARCVQLQKVIINIT